MSTRIYKSFRFSKTLLKNRPFLNFDVTMTFFFNETLFSKISFKSNFFDILTFSSSSVCRLTLFYSIGRR